MRNFSFSFGSVAILSFILSFQALSQNIIEQLEPSFFQAKMSETENAQILDVRTPGEFEKGYISSAMNINVNDASFEQKLAAVSKEKPVFVYCLSGGRSGSASKRLQKLGFTIVYDLKGGILAWQNGNLPVVTPQGATNLGISLQQYQSELESEVPVLVDFYAPWCGPCKKMAPMLETLSTEKSGEFKFLKINADENKALMKELNVIEIPTILIYKKGELRWQHIGLVDEATLAQELGL